MICLEDFEDGERSGDSYEDEEYEREEVMDVYDSD